VGRARAELHVKQDVQVTLHDLQQTITTLIQFPTLFERLQPLLVALLPYLDGSNRCGKFGLDHTGNCPAATDANRPRHCCCRTGLAP
jgi:hypothetical protein